MVFLFELIKGVFVLLTFVLALLAIKGTALLPAESVIALQSILLPGYLVLCGILVGYLFGHMQSHPVDDHSSHPVIYSNAFIWGILLGVVFALLYIYRGVF